MKNGLLLSGGIDSIAVCFWLRPQIAFTIDYGQLSAEAEISAATQVAKALSIEHEIISIDCSQVGRGSMTNNAAGNQDAPHHIVPSEEWWPYRNQLLATFAGSRCLVKRVGRLLLGSVATDSVHKDGSRQFYRALNAVFRMQEGCLRIIAPAINMTSIQLIQRCRAPIELLAWSHSCHRGNLACGRCRGCFKHQSVFEAVFPDHARRALITDPGSLNTVS